MSLLGSCFSSVESSATTGLQWKTFYEPRMVLWMRKVFRVSCAHPFWIQFLRFCQFVLNKAFWARAVASSTSLAGLQCLWSVAKDWIRSVSVLFALIWLHLTYLHSRSQALCLDCWSILVIFTSDRLTNLQTKATRRAKLCEVELRV